MKLLRLSLFCVLIACQSQPPPPAPAPPPTPGPPSAFDIQHAKLRGFLKRRSERPIEIETRTPEQLTQAACRGRDGQWLCRGPKPMAAAGIPVQPITPSSWTIPNWYIDPANSSGCAADFNNCTSAVCGGAGVGPCVTWGEINVHRWGCLGNPTSCPVLPQTTGVTFLSSQTGLSDPIVWLPLSNNGGDTNLLSAVLPRGTPFSLGTVTPKNRAAGSNSPLIAVVSGGAVGQLLVNTTHPSFAFVQHSNGAGAFNISQPVTGTALNSFTFPVEVDTWATGNTVAVQPLVQINLVKFAPQFTSIETPGVANIFGLHISNGTSNVLNTVLDGTSGAFFLVQNSWFEANLFATNSDGVYSESFFFNDLFGSASLSDVFDFAGGGSLVNGASTFGQNFGFGSTSAATFIVDGDVILDAPILGLGNVSCGFLYLNGIFLSATEIEVSVGDYGDATTYGSASGNFRLDQRARLRSDGLTFTHAITMPIPIASGITMNGLQTANSMTVSGGIGTIHTGITTTVSALDAPAGVAGFGGNAFRFDGAIITNQH